MTHEKPDSVKPEEEHRESRGVVVDQDFMNLLEASSLGSPAARRIRSLTPARAAEEMCQKAARIRPDTDAGRAAPTCQAADDSGIPAAQGEAEPVSELSYLAGHAQAPQPPARTPARGIREIADVPALYRAAAEDLLNTLLSYLDKVSLNSGKPLALDELITGINHGVIDHTAETDPSAWEKEAFHGEEPWESVPEVHDQGGQPPEYVASYLRRLYFATAAHRMLDLRRRLEEDIPGLGMHGAGGRVRESRGEVRIALLGSAGTGKSSLLSALSRDKPSLISIPTGAGKSFLAALILGLGPDHELAPFGQSFWWTFRPSAVDDHWSRTVNANAPNAAAGLSSSLLSPGAAGEPYRSSRLGETAITPYAGHGTFTKGVLRCAAHMAPVSAETAFDNTAAESTELGRRTVSGPRQGIFGIDLGTTYSVVSYIDETGRPAMIRNSERGDVTPSVAYFETVENVAFGKAPDPDPEQVFSLIKREMADRDYQRTFFGIEHSLPSSAALILSALAKGAAADTRRETANVMITVPAYFGLLEKDAARQAGEIAGLNVIGFVPEPVAAALHYGVTGSADGATFLVSDLGGGTHNISLIKMTETSAGVIAVGGDHRISGVDWDEKLLGYISEAIIMGCGGGSLRAGEAVLQELRALAEKTKNDQSAAESKTLIVQDTGPDLAVVKGAAPYATGQTVRYAGTGESGDQPPAAGQLGGNGNPGLVAPGPVTAAAAAQSGLEEEMPDVLVHRLIFAVDIEGSTARTDPAKRELRHILYELLDQALATAGIARQHLEQRADRGDGVLLLIQPHDDVPDTMLLRRGLAAAIENSDPSAAQTFSRAILAEIGTDSLPPADGDALEHALTLLDPDPADTSQARWERFRHAIQAAVLSSPAAAALDGPAVIMGVAGCGKTTIGQLLAGALRLPYAEADSFHPAGNVAKMEAGTALTDQDREPWLQAIAGRIRQDGPVVVSCSALKRAYRDVLRQADPRTWFLHLAIDQEIAAERVAGRAAHFMPPSLVNSQFADLEPLHEDENGLTVDGNLPREQILATAIRALAGPRTPELARSSTAPEGQAHHTGTR